MSIDMKALRKYAIISGAYLLLSILLFYPMILNIASSVPGSGGDVFQSLWDIWWVPYSLFTLHASPYFSSYVFYPVGANLATQTFAPIAGLVSAIFQPHRRRVRIQHRSSSSASCSPVSSRTCLRTTSPRTTWRVLHSRIHLRVQPHARDPVVRAPAVHQHRVHTPLPPLLPQDDRGEEA